MLQKKTATINCHLLSNDCIVVIKLLKGDIETPSYKFLSVS